MSSEELNNVLALISQAQGEDHREKPVWQQRGEMELTGLAMPMPEETVDVEQARMNSVPALKFVPDGAKGDSALLYMHGGGYVLGSPISHRHLVARLAVDAGMVAWSIDYRLAPEFAFPAAVEDALIAYRYLLDQGIEASRIILGGDSAGGGLATALLIALKAQGLAQPGGAILLSPWVDLTQTGDTYESRAASDPMVQKETLNEMAAAYVQNGDAGAAIASPLFADLKGVAPMYIQVGDAETLLSDSLRLAETARAAGVTVRLDHYPDMVHVWQYFWPMLSEAREACKKLSEYCVEQIG